jgi:hypothetical protein
VLILAIAFLARGWSSQRVPGEERRTEEVTERVAPPPRPLLESVADATSATLALARETSAPAARIGREVLSSANLSSTDWTVSLPSNEAGNVLQSVGSQVEAGVRPLSGTARSAFGFLLPAVAPDAAVAKQPSKGA